MPLSRGRRGRPAANAPPDTAAGPTLSSVSTPTGPATTVAPRVIPRDQHPISRRSISPNALRVLYRLRDAGHAAYLVGGAVRDLLLGIQPKDFDVATDATPEQVRHLFRNCRLIGRRFRLAHVVFGREIIEVATFRSGGGSDGEGEGDREVHADGRVLRDNVYGTIEEDAVRRDFTANALYYAIEDFSVRDYVGGFDDVQARVLRLIGDPETRYREDPVRMLRAVRLAAKLGFSIDPAAAAPMPQLASLLHDAAPARLFDECQKLFLSGHALASFEGLEAHGLLAALLPETARALASNRSGALRRMLVEGLQGTDARIARGEPVSPAFLFALLLWPGYCRELMQLQGQGVHAIEAERRAADRVTLQQSTRIALPRRFSLPMQEIWLLQSRMRQRKRSQRLLAHPRFRAAFDFLVLRQAAAPEHAADVEYWRALQAGMPPPETDGEPPAEEATAGASPARRRRRRRRGGGAG
jgi:poly(A) polymerase